MTMEGTVRPSDRYWAFPLHMVPKSWRRACVDYRFLNAMTRPDRCSISHVLNFHKKLHVTSVSSKIDLLRVFHQIHVAEEDIPKTAVPTPFGLFQYHFVNSELCNVTQSFQQFMNKVIK